MTGTRSTRLTLPHARGGRPPRARPWSHQQDLAGLTDETVQIYVATGDGVSPKFEGVLIAADQYTIKIRLAPSSEIVIFKSAIAAFKRMSPRSSQEPK